MMIDDVRTSIDFKGREFERTFGLWLLELCVLGFLDFDILMLLSTLIFWKLHEFLEDLRFIYLVASLF